MVHPFFNFFNFGNFESYLSKCKCKMCGANLKGRHAANSSFLSSETVHDPKNGRTEPNLTKILRESEPQTPSRNFKNCLNPNPNRTWTPFFTGLTPWFKRTRDNRQGCRIARNATVIRIIRAFLCVLIEKIARSGNPKGGKVALPSKADFHSSS